MLTGFVPGKAFSHVIMEMGGAINLLSHAWIYGATFGLKRSVGLLNRENELIKADVFSKIKRIAW